VAYWPALAVGSTAQLAAAHCPNERTLDPQSASRQTHLHRGQLHYGIHPKWTVNYNHTEIHRAHMNGYIGKTKKQSYNGDYLPAFCYIELTRASPELENSFQHISFFKLIQQYNGKYFIKVICSRRYMVGKKKTLVRFCKKKWINTFSVRFYKTDCSFSFCGSVSALCVVCVYALFWWHLSLHLYGMTLEMTYFRRWIGPTNSQPKLLRTRSAEIRHEEKYFDCWSNRVGWWFVNETSENHPQTTEVGFWNPNCGNWVYSC